MGKALSGTVNLPRSKSESNRALMIAAYGGFPLQVEHLSEAHDTVLLQQLLAKIEHSRADSAQEINCEDAGTVARFLLTYLACRKGVWVMTGTERMQQRPMKPLVDALRQLGADIVCLSRDGFLPMRVTGRPLTGGKAEIDVSQSSQFVSSLVLAAPTWKHGLTLTLKGNPVSIPYLEMTHSMMRLFGADVSVNDAVISVAPKPYKPSPFQVTADWSAASVWYELVALAEKGSSLLLKGLSFDILQGDSSVKEMFRLFGVETSFETEGARLLKATDEGCHPQPLVFDVTDTPDLFPALLATCVALHRSSVFYGTRNLMYKESNRVVAMISELSKVYTFINIIKDNSVVVEESFNKNDSLYSNNILFSTNNDHRILMALAPLSVKIGRISFDYPEVVSKSYPGFWVEIESLTLF